MAYKDILRNAITSFEDLERWLTGQKARVDPRLRDVIARYPMRVNTYYLGLIQKMNDPIWKQAIPDVEELEHHMDLVADPLDEEGDIPLGGPRTIIHRYPDRVLLFVSIECAMYCRFCTRKRKVGDNLKNPSIEEIGKGIDYIAAHDEIRDVLISGGDPLLIPVRRLDEILGRLTAIPHLDIVRIGTRVPCVWPQKLIEDTELVEVLRKHTPKTLKEPQLFMNTHFNHPNEITEQSFQAVKILRDLGIPMGNQTVLLKGVNDDTDVMRDLVHGLGRMGVRPYYLYYADLVEGPVTSGPKCTRGGRSAGTSADPPPGSCGRPTSWTRWAAGARCPLTSGIRTGSARTARAGRSPPRSGSARSTSTTRSRRSRASRPGTTRTGPSAAVLTGGSVARPGAGFP